MVQPVHDVRLRWHSCAFTHPCARTHIHHKHTLSDMLLYTHSHTFTHSHIYTHTLTLTLTHTHMLHIYTADES